MDRWCSCHHNYDEHSEFEDQACQAINCPCVGFQETWACGACGAEYDSAGAASYCHYGCVGV